MVKKRGVDITSVRFKAPGITSLLYWSPFIILLIINFYFNLSPTPDKLMGFTKSIWDFVADYYFHFIAYFFISFFLGMALSHSQSEILNKNSYFKAFVITFFIGYFMEFLQNYVPTRVSDLNDTLYNFYGALAAQILRFVLKLEKVILDRVF